MEIKFTMFDTFLDSVQSITQRELLDAKEILSLEGKNIENLSDILVGESGELFDLLPDGRLVKVNLYIAVKSIDKSHLNYIQPKDIYKYHLYKCSTISQMFETGRKHRYKINNRVDGTFYFTFSDYRGGVIAHRENQKLNVCKNCLKRFLQKQFASDYDVENFNLKDFHQHRSSFFDFDTSSLEKGEDARPNTYTYKWNEISTQLRKKYNYTCQECGWRAKTTYQQRFIHTHHQNGDKQNNQEENLKVLCIECHSNVDRYHSRIKSTSSYREFKDRCYNSKKVRS